MADSHENMPMIKRAVDLFNRECAGLVLHAGDIISPITAKENGRSALSSAPIAALETTNSSASISAR